MVDFLVTKKAKKKNKKASHINEGSLFVILARLIMAGVHLTGLEHLTRADIV